MPTPLFNVPKEDAVAALVATRGELKGASEKLGCTAATLRAYCERVGIDVARIRRETRSKKAELTQAPKGDALAAPPLTVSQEEILRVLTKARQMNLMELCDAVGMPPSPVLEIVDGLHKDGYRVPAASDIKRSGHIELTTTKDLPYVASHNEYDIDFEGDTYLCATVSDTHLSSIHERPEYIEAAYDMIEKLGITEVYHGGDLSCGMGIYPGQINEVKHVRIDDQVEHAIKVYPRRKGITTKIIGGNHDLEGVSGRIGINPIKRFCQARDDFEYLGEYSAWFNLPNGTRVQMLHPMGGGSYAVSYRPQKHIESYTEAEKPDILWIAHYHKTFYMPGIRNIHAFLLGTFEAGSMLATRRGLGQPGLGFWVHKITMKPRGVVQYAPTWYSFLDGVPDLIKP